jgi:uncharacterized membrane protein
MILTRARRQQLTLSWIGIVVTWVASLGLELALLGDRAPLAIAITSGLLLVVGIVLTRRVLTPHRRARITVGDLRQRRRRPLERA